MQLVIEEIRYINIDIDIDNLAKAKEYALEAYKDNKELMHQQEVRVCVENFKEADVSLDSRGDLKF